MQNINSLAIDPLNEMPPAPSIRSQRDQEYMEEVAIGSPYEVREGVSYRLCWEIKSGELIREIDCNGWTGLVYNEVIATFKTAEEAVDAWRDCVDNSNDQSIEYFIATHRITGKRHLRMTP